MVTAPKFIDELRRLDAIRQKEKINFELDLIRAYGQHALRNVAFIRQSSRNLNKGGVPQRSLRFLGGNMSPHSDAGDESGSSRPGTKMSGAPEATERESPEKVPIWKRWSSKTKVLPQ